MPKLSVLVVLVASFSVASFATATAQPGSLPTLEPTQTPTQVQGTMSSAAQTVSSAAADSALTLDVVAAGKDGKPIAGLQQGDFTVTVNGAAQPVAGFQSSAAAQSTVPSEVILLLDAVNTTTTNVAYERQQVEKYLKANGGRLAHPTTLVILTDTNVEITPQPLQDGNELSTFLSKATIGIRTVGRSTGFYGWTEQFQLSASALQRLAAHEQTRAGRKLLVWISPGWPLLSGPEVRLSTKDENQLFGDLVALTASLRKARITLSSVDPLGTADSVSYRTLFYQEFEKGVPSPNKMQIGNLALQVLALQSGGRVLNSNNDVAAEIGTCVSDEDAFYTLRLNLPPSEKPNEYRSIAVKLDKTGVTARTRTGYYAQP